MKLKTLKDLENGFKVEAIKWIKHSDEIANNPEASQDELRNFWMDRFDITEEDLK